MAVGKQKFLVRSLGLQYKIMMQDIVIISMDSKI